MSNLKFDFSKSPIKSDEEFETKMASEGGKEIPYLGPGRYEVVIKSAEYKGPASDPSWQKLEITYEDIRKKTIRETLPIPTKSLTYQTTDGRESMFVFKKVNGFLVALGLPSLKPSNAADVLTEYFARPEKSLVKLPLAITVGYTNNHVSYEGKDNEGNRRYVIRMKDGSTLTKKDGGTLTFPEFEAAKEYAEQQGVTLQAFANVTMHEATAAAKKTGTSNW